MVELPEDFVYRYPPACLADNASASALPGRWRWSRKSWFATRPPAPWMCPFRRPSSSSWFGCSGKSKSASCSSANDLALVQSFFTRLRLCIWDMLEVIPGEQVARGRFIPIPRRCSVRCSPSIWSRERKSRASRAKLPAPGHSPGLPLPESVSPLWGAVCWWKTRREGPDHLVACHGGRAKKGGGGPCGNQFSGHHTGDCNQADNRA